MGAASVPLATREATALLNDGRAWGETVLVTAPGPPVRRAQAAVLSRDSPGVSPPALR